MRNVDAVILRNLVKIRAIRVFERVDNIPNYVLYIHRQASVFRAKAFIDEARKQGRALVHCNGEYTP